MFQRMSRRFRYGFTTAPDNPYDSNGAERRGVKERFYLVVRFL